MKHLFLAILAFPLLVNSQTKTYLDPKWKPTTKEKAAFYRISEKQGELFKVSDYFINGNLQFSGTSHSENEPFELEGKAVWYFENGKIEREAEFTHNKISGKSATYYSNGTKKEEGQYVNGEPNGAFFQYFPSGATATQGVFKNGKMNGPYVSYESENSKKMEMNFVDGIPHGHYEEFSRGKARAKGTMAMGYMDGECLSYDYYGNLLSKANFRNKLLHGAYIHYGQDSKIKAKGEFVDGVAKSFELLESSETNGSRFSSKMTLKKDIESWQIFRDGKRVAETQYKQGKPFGIWKIYTWDGSELYETLDFSKAECKAEELQQARESSNFFMVSGRFSEDFYKTFDCEGVATKTFFEGSQASEMHPLYHHAKKAEEAKKPKATYQADQIEKDGESGYKVSLSGTANEDIDYKDQANDAEFLKRNSCEAYSNGFSGMTICKRKVEGINYIVFTSEKTADLEKLKAALKPKDDEIIFFFQKFEERIYKAGEHPGRRYMGFSIPAVLKEAMKTKVMDLLSVSAALEHHVFDMEKFSGMAASDAIEKELKK